MPEVPVATETPSPAAAPTLGTSPPPIATPNAPAGAPVANPVRFADAARGWLGLEDGIVGTSDGGRTWTRQLRSPARIAHVWSFDATHAWALAADHTVYRTADGARWDTIPPTQSPIRDVQFVAALVGWAIAYADTPSGQAPRSEGTLLASTDGGVIWRTVPTAQPIRSACFVDERQGWGADGETVLRTSDGGRSWKLVFDARHGGAWFPTLACSNLTSAVVQLTAPFAALSHAPYLVYATTDAGATWSLRYAELYTLGGREAPMSTPVLGSYPSIIGALSGGRTWFLTCTPPLDQQSYLLIDTSGATLATGRVPLPTCPLDGQAIDEQRVAVVGPNAPPRVLLSEDGGASWSAIYPR